MEVEPEILFNEENDNENVPGINTGDTIDDISNGDTIDNISNGNTNINKETCVSKGSTDKSPEMGSEMDMDVSDMVQNLLKSRPAGMSPLQCSECDLECPSQSALEFHTQLHVMERMVQSSYKYPGIGLKRKSNRESKRISYKENDNIHVDEARDIKTMMESLVSPSKRTSVKIGKKAKKIKIKEEIKIEDEIKSEDEKKVKRKRKKTYKCKVCDRKFKVKDNLEKHMLKHSDFKSFVCTQCGHQCAKISQLTRHMLTHSSEKRHACPLCDYRCNDKGNLTKHLLTHGDAKPFSCPEENCDYKCKFKCNLKSHMLKHTGERPFACHICDYKSIDKNGLTTHMSHHTGERPFPCTVCGNRYASNANLKVHMRIHTGDKKFKCEHCDSKFFTQSKLDQHVRTHTGEKPYECLECGHRFTSSSNLNKHMKTHFGGAKPRQRKQSKPEKEITINLNSLTTINVNSLTTPLNVNSLTSPLFVQRKPNKSSSSMDTTTHNKTALSYGPYVPQSVESPQLPYDLSQHSQHSELSNDSSLVHHTFHQSNAQTLINQHLIGTNSIMGRTIQEMTHPDVNYKNNSNYSSPVKSSWHQGNSSNPAENVDDYNYQNFIDKLLHTRQQAAGENYSQVSQNYSHPSLSSHSAEHTHLNSKIPSAVPAQPNMSEMIRHANYMYNMQ